VFDRHINKSNHHNTTLWKVLSETSMAKDVQEYNTKKDL
jgi:hypothetical protein